MTTGHSAEKQEFITEGAYALSAYAHTFAALRLLARGMLKGAADVDRGPAHGAQAARGRQPAALQEADAAEGVAAA